MKTQQCTHPHHQTTDNTRKCDTYTYTGVWQGYSIHFKQQYSSLRVITDTYIWTNMAVQPVTVNKHGQYIQQQNTF